MFRVVFAIVLTLLGMIGMASAQTRQRVPTVFEAGHFFATPTMDDGRRLRFLVDTGGPGGSGWYVFARQVPERLGLPTGFCPLDGERFRVVVELKFRAGQGLPVATPTPCDSPALASADLTPIAGEDGNLGAGYLSRFVWTFDYPRHTLWREGAGWHAPASARPLPLGLVRDQAGRIDSGLARINVRVDGEVLPLLLDTGATAAPTVEGRKATGTPVVNGVGVTSYITTRMLERWHRAHPDWRMVADGDVLLGDWKARLIEVPRVEMAGWIVGPVWFTERPNQAFSTANGGMSSFTDQPVEGSAGANLYRGMAMSLDYSAGTAWFSCHVGCRAVRPSRLGAAATSP